MLESTLITDPDTDKHIFMPISGHIPTVGFGQTYNRIFLNVRQSPAAGTMTYDALLFGLITE